MRVVITRATLRTILDVSLLATLLFALFLGVSITADFVAAGNVTNATAITTVNVSNTFPVLYKVKIDHPLDSSGNVDLQAGNATTVICNGSASDFNGFDDIVAVNATLYLDGFSSGPVDNNSFYLNSSCGTCEQVTGEPDNATCLCQFAVQYYAEPGNWICNMTILDSGTLTSINSSPQTTFNEILGISISVPTIDYGNLSVTETSLPIHENITNIGNIPMNMTLRGFGGTVQPDPTNNLTMICDPSVSARNITINEQRVSISNETAYADMVNLTNETQLFPDLTIPKRRDNNDLHNSTNVTYWKLLVPLGTAGRCNGSIVFGAIDAT